MFIVNNKNTRRRFSVLLLTLNIFHSVSVVDFEQVNLQLEPLGLSKKLSKGVPDAKFAQYYVIKFRKCPILRDKICRRKTIN